MTEYQEAKRQMVGHHELTREREERIDKLKAELAELKEQYYKVDIELETLKINYSKTMDLYDVCSKDLEDTVQKLHTTNKVRHETEIKLAEEVDKVRSLQELAKLKEETLSKRQGQIEELDRKVLEMERSLESAEIKR